MIERIREFFKTFLLVELFKGLAVTGRYMSTVPLVLATV